MDRITAEILCKITDDFYATQAHSFSATRQAPWEGWDCVLREVGLLEYPSIEDPDSRGMSSVHPSLEGGLFRNMAVPFTALDVGAGNLRFFKYVREQLPSDVQLDFYAVDNCEAMLPDEEALANEMPYVRFEKVDVLQRLVHGADLVDAIEAPPCSLVTSFGLMHHVPGMALRADLLNALVRMAAPGGYVAVSFWQFMENEELAAKARTFHERAMEALQFNPVSLDFGDYLLGWQELAPQPGNIRYAHSFTTPEIDALAASVGDRAKVHARFNADGRSGDLNHYLILRVL